MSDANYDANYVVYLPSSYWIIGMFLMKSQANCCDVLLTGVYLPTVMLTGIYLLVIIN